VLRAAYFLSCSTVGHLGASERMVVWRQKRCCHFSRAHLVHIIFWTITCYSHVYMQVMQNVGRYLFFISRKN